MHVSASPSLHAAPAEMSEAIQLARASIGQFFTAYDAPRTNQCGFMLRVRFTAQSPTGESAAEHLWLRELSFASNPPTGVIASEPYLPGMKYLERVSFDAQQVSDWMYLEDRQVVGAFTTRLLRGDEPQPTSRFTLLRDLWRL